MRKCPYCKNTELAPGTYCPCRIANALKPDKPKPPSPSERCTQCDAVYGQYHKSLCNIQGRYLGQQKQFNEALRSHLAEPVKESGGEEAAEAYGKAFAESCDYTTESPNSRVETAVYDFLEGWKSRDSAFEQMKRERDELATKLKWVQVPNVELTAKNETLTRRNASLMSAHLEEGDRLREIIAALRAELAKVRAEFENLKAITIDHIPPELE